MSERGKQPAQVGPGRRGDPGRRVELTPFPPEAGIVLIAVLWGIVLLTLVAIALATAMRTGVEGLQSQKEQLQAHYYARGAIYQTLGLLLAPPPPSATGPDSYSGPPPQADWRGTGWEATVQISDEAGKLDVNRAPERMLVRLFQALGLNQTSAQSLGDAIEAWRNPDTSGGMSGGEDSYYLSLRPPYQPAHADFQSIGELLLVRGVTPGLYYGGYVTRPDGRVERLPGLVDCLTTNASGAAININSAPYPVLMAVPGMDQEVANSIVQERERRPFASLNKLTEDFPASLDAQTLSYLTTQASGRFSLLATATVAGGVSARVRALTELEPGKDPPFQFVRWDDSYVR
ncbi:MAG TPA: helix-hairpin-helix domain-containing protein [Candidatus Acidoferrales bacterium]|nr:helix-hairpin-helix domain-containing protein [Candidatus Acidoferrales bacterium]